MGKQEHVQWVKRVKRVKSGWKEYLSLENISIFVKSKNPLATKVGYNWLSDFDWKPI